MQVGNMYQVKSIVNYWSHFGYEFTKNDENYDLENLISSISNFNINCCSAEELMNQVSFDYDNYFNE